MRKHVLRLFGMLAIAACASLALAQDRSPYPFRRRRPPAEDR